MGKKRDVGRSLIKGALVPVLDKSGRHKISLNGNNDWYRLPVRSVTEETGLAEFFSIAELANKDFKAQKRNVKFLSSSDLIGIPCAKTREKMAAIQDLYKNQLKIPRRPEWNKQMSVDELEALEKEEFLKWRRSLAELEETDGVVLTPFERNLEFWRQLWRVVERSDVIVQVVDARQPLLYYCKDLELYVNEVDSNKVSVVLVNKSDFLTEQQRLAWSNYFTSINIRAIFWSAALSGQFKLGINLIDDGLTKDLNHKENTPNLDRENSSDNESDVSDLSSNDSTLIESSNEENLKDLNAEISCEQDNLLTNDQAHIGENIEIHFNKNVEEHFNSKVSNDDDDDDNESSNLNNNSLSKIVNVEELLEMLSSTYCPPISKRVKSNQLTIGFVGYPNVGKSSTLNAILGHKKVSVSITPGKTKHFQTIFVRSDLILCDCPGLVMPSFAYSKADLIVAGILSVDQMRDYLSPIGLVCDQIPRSVLESMYGINLAKPKIGEPVDRPPTPHELLGAYAFMHGFMTAKGNPNYDRSARLILKDYLLGRLLYCHALPGFDPKEFQSLGRSKQGCLPIGIGYLSESKIERFIKRTGINAKKSANPSHEDLFLKEFDRMAFDSQIKKTSSHIRSHKRMPILRSRLEQSNGSVSENDDGDETGSNCSWVTNSTQSSIGSSIGTLGSSSFVIGDADKVRKPWRLLSHSKCLNSNQQTSIPFRKHNGANQNGGGAYKKKRKDKLRRVYVHLDQHEKL